MLQSLYGFLNNRQPPSNPWLLDITILLTIALLVRIFCFVGLGFNDDSIYTGNASILYQGRPFQPVKGYMATRLAILFPIVLSWKALGINAFSTSLYFLLCSLGTVALTYFLARRLFDRRTAWVSAFLMCFFPVNVIYASQVGPDVPLHFLSLLLVLFVLRVCNKYRYNHNGLPAVQDAFACGIIMGLAYLTKTTYILFLPLMVITIAFSGRYCGPDQISETRGSQARRCAGTAVAFLLGFLCLFVPAQLYFTGITGEWFGIEKFRHYATTHDQNNDTRFMFYPLAMLNLTKGLYDWAHGIPAFGFMYWGLLGAGGMALAHREFRRKTLFLWLWIIGFFFFYQYFLYIYATWISPIGHPRQFRYLILLSAPACMIMAHVTDRFLLSGNARSLRITGVALIIFLAATSLGYSHAGAGFLRQGMAEVRETALRLQAKPEKPFYLPDTWSESHFYFFTAYDYDRYYPLLRKYRFKIPANGTDPDDVHDRISDAYVVLDMSPYSHGSRDQWYPSFCGNPPPEWILLDEIHFPNRGLFERYNPRIYYAPAREGK